MANIGKILRRSFLVGSAAIAGGVAFGYYKYRQPLQNPLAPGDDEVTLNPYLLITKQGITIITPRAEMGQGVHTTLAALVAEELDVAWEDVHTIHGPASSSYYNAAILAAGLPFAEYRHSRTKDFAVNAARVGSKFLGMQVTGGSSSMADGFDKMRHAGAAARQVLLEAAAQHFNTSAVFLKTEDGHVINRNGEKVSYVDLAQAAAEIEPPDTAELKNPKSWRYLGKSMPRVDMAAKVTGTAEFAIDVKLDGMVYGAVRANPHLGAGMVSFDASAAESMPGVQKIVDLGNGIGVIAGNTWQAFQAAEAVEIEWEEAAYPADSEQIFAAIGEAFEEKPNSTLRDDGDIDAALLSKTVISAEYRVPYLAHATMEPMTAVAWLHEDNLEIWAGNQAPTMIRDQAVKTSGLAPDAVAVHTTYMGGGFGRRGEFDFTNQAVRLAMAVPGKPVKLTWTREEDMGHDFYRPAAIARIQGKYSPKGPLALKIDIAAPSVLRQQGKRALGSAMPGPDKLLVEGAFDQPYAISDFQVNGFVSEVPIPVGSWRSVGNSYNGFFLESFLDELAAAENLDPVEMRLKLMAGQHPASLKAVETVAQMASWGGAIPEGKGRGMAFTNSFGSPTAQIIDVSQTEDGIKIDNVFCAIDVGIALDPRNIEAQVTSAIIYGLSAAIYGEITFEEGKVSQSNFHDYDALRMNQMPEFSVEILQNNPHISGVGEPGTPPSIPALANAVFSLTGERIRTLPLGNSVDFL